jgi:hypothetical protein
MIDEVVNGTITKERITNEQPFMETIDHENTNRQYAPFHEIRQ